MQLWNMVRDNGKIEPWLVENERIFQGHVYWNSWMFGLECWEGAWTLRLGPINVTYWKSK